MTRRGFTLLEMLVATTIMAVAVIGLLSGIANTTRNAARLRDYDRVVQLARLRMNDLLLEERLPLGVVVSGDFDRQQAGGLEAGWRARVTNFERPPSPAPGQSTLDRLELEVWWMSAGRRRTFTLDAYRTRLLRPEDMNPGAAAQ